VVTRYKFVTSVPRLDSTGGWPTLSFADTTNAIGCPTRRGFVKSREILYILSLDILYNGWRGTGPRNPALDDFRALDSGVQFAN
jgi:hypothetical protein